MRTKKALLIATMIACIVIPAFAREITLDEAVSSALRNNLQMKNSEIDLKMTENAYIYSYNTLIPTASASATFSRANEEGSGIPFKKEVMFTYGISGSWTFNPAMITSIRIARENYKNGQLTYEQACTEMTQNIRKLYFSIVLQQEALEIQKATLKAQEDRYLQAQKDFENGYIPELALLQIRVAYENAKPTFEEAKNGLESAKRQFLFLLGSDIDEEAVLTTPISHDFVEIKLKDALSTLSERNDLKSIEVQSKLLKMQKEALIESTFLPSLVLKASWQPVLADIDLNKDYWQDAGSISGTVAWDLSNLLPISGQYKNLSDIANGQKKLENGKQMAYDNARIEIINLVDKLNQIENSLISSEASINLAQKNYDARVISYNVGSSDFLDLQDAENQLSQAKLGKLSNQFNYISALIDFEDATGQKYF